MKGATNIKVYTNAYRDPLPKLVKGKAALAGDAGHLMLSTHGQGASTAIEDAMALEVLFSGNVMAEDVPNRLKLFEQLRLPRVSAVQTLSNKMMGPPEAMLEEARRYFDGRDLPGPGAKTFSQEYNDLFFLYDVAEAARALLESGKHEDLMK